MLRAPNAINSYGVAIFPGITDTIFNITHSQDSDVTPRKWNEVRRQIDIVRTHLRHATQILREPVLQYLKTT